ncbi:MAG: tRNA(Met) cytidine acetate ligase [Sporanaerobacter sp.]|jgi:predicted nucleotidyltransferase|uniref:nucleotidyltransferase n=1 Tax=Sporanaerobacter sp. TaxID=2010183 RepID=UPI003A101A53
MKVVGLITEYNPFHYGHLYHLQKSKEITNSDFSIAIMSGSFVQRGEPSIVDKWTKAKMAIDNGIDLVLELPTIYAVQSAELFAYGGIRLLDSLNIVDYFCFGSEEGNIEPLKKIAEILVDEPKDFRVKLKYYLDKGNSFPIARSMAIDEYFKNDINLNFNPMSIMNSPNNILGIEYLKALYKYNIDILPITIKRIGSEYKEEQLNNKVASATAIRKKALNHNLIDLQNYIPPNTYNHLVKYLSQYGSLNTLENYSQILLYLLRTTDKNHLSKIMDVEDGLENRFIQYSFKYSDIKQITNTIITKRYTRTRIQRILTHLMLNLDKPTFLKLNNVYPKYIRVLGMNESGMKLLKEIKKNTSIPIINKFSDYKKYDDSMLEEMIHYDKLSTDLFFLGFKNTAYRFGNKDFTTSPYIKK